MGDVNRKRLSRSERHQMLLDAAAAVLSRRDATGLTFEQVAEEAGVSPTLPYKYFESPDDIAVELYDRIVTAIDDQVDAVIGADLTFDEKASQSFDLWCEAARTHGHLLLSLIDGRVLPSLRGRIDRRRERSVKLWAGVIVDDYGIDHDDALLVAASITAATSALLTRWLRDRRSRRETVEAFRRLAVAQCEAFVPG